MNFTIPKTTPPGKYLVRVEHFNISPYYNMTQMFVNCAQVEVTGPGGGMSRLYIIHHKFCCSKLTSVEVPLVQLPSSLGHMILLIKVSCNINHVDVLLMKEKGIWLPRSMYNPYKPTDLLKNYKGPGPEIWTG
jgi:hypothetical protein